MKKRILAAITGGVWIAAIGSAAALTYALNRPVELRDVTSSWSVKTRDVDNPRQAVEETAVVSYAEEMPAMVVVGHLRRGRGVAEMMPPDDLIIGPGVVTHVPEGPSRSDGGAPVPPVPPE
jgi:hypothetical protein